MPARIAHQVRVLQSVATSTLAGWRGTSVLHAATQPTQRFKLYDMEGSPACRDVREALTALGLDAEIYPCPEGGKRYRAQAKQIGGRKGGKLHLPLLVDANTNTTLHGSARIVDYLFRIYGGRETPRAYRAGALRPLVGVLGSAVCGLRGIKVRPVKHPKKHPEQLLELWSFESSPYSRLVREMLTELEIAYVLHNLGKEQFADMGPAVMRVKPGPYKPRPGGRREKVLAQLGRIQLPYLEDPNTGVKMYESRKIIDYLERQYAA